MSPAPLSRILGPSAPLSPLGSSLSPPRRAIAWVTTFIGVTGPTVGVIVAAVLLWGNGFGWVDLALLSAMYVLASLGITVGYHRLFTHRAFHAAKPVEFAFGVLGSITFQGPIFTWVGLHRMHHRYSDLHGDPHSPHNPHESFAGGARAWLRGFWHAHLGWAFAPMPDAIARYVGDLRRSRMLRIVNVLFPLWAVLGLLVPAAIGYAFTGWWGALSGFIWGGLVRVFLVHHVTWSINSVCHLWGTRPYKSRDESRNNPIFGLAGLGEGWHNNHHAFPASAKFGHRWYEIDVGYWVIRSLEFCGLAWRLRLPAPQQLTARARVKAS